MLNQEIYNFVIRIKKIDTLFFISQSFIAFYHSFQIIVTLLKNIRQEISSLLQFYKNKFKYISIFSFIMFGSIFRKIKIIINIETIYSVYRFDPL